MIPLRDQDFLRQHFAAELKSRVRVDLFTQRPSPVIIPGRQECVYCEDVRGILRELASLSNRIVLTEHDIDSEKPLAHELGVDRVPATVLRGTLNRPMRFFGFPSGSQFPVFIAVMLDVARGSGTVELDAETVRQLRRLKTDVRLQVLVTTTCPHSPTAVRTAVRLALQSVRVKVDILEIAEYPELGRRLGVRAVPTTVIGDKVLVPGVIDEPVLAQSLLRFAEGRPVPAETQPGPSTPVDPAMFEPQQSRPGARTTSSGLILPR